MSDLSDLIAEVRARHTPDRSGYCAVCMERDCGALALANAAADVERERDDYRRQCLAGVYDAASVGVTLIRSEALAELRGQSVLEVTHDARDAGKWATMDQGDE